MVFNLKILVKRRKRPKMWIPLPENYCISENGPKLPIAIFGPEKKNASVDLSLVM